MSLDPCAMPGERWLTSNKKGSRAGKEWKLQAAGFTLKQALKLQMLLSRAGLALALEDA